ncbi:MAG: hypothetical protein ABIL69_03975, partial [candidate division WOR-3 bacterium]
MAKIMVIFFIPATFLVLLGESLDLNDLIDSALVYNLEIKAAQARYESSTQNSPFKTLMDPMFGIEFSNDMRMY